MFSRQNASRIAASDRQQFHLADHTGKIILAFFGYTSCPDVCPSTLSDMKRVAGILDDDSESIVVLFITVDPERDTVEKLNAYVSLFDSRFLGLTGDEDQLEKVWRDYGVFREIDTTSQTAAGYLVNHSSRIYLIDQDGRLFLTYAYGTPADDIAKDVAYLLKQ